MNKTSIEWTDYTWNPVTGCTKVSAGCRSCYAETLFTRFGKSWGQADFTDVTLHYERLDEPVTMGKKLSGKKVFVVDMGDLFHEKVPFTFIVSVYARMRECPDTIFQILTKRIDRALECYQRLDHFMVMPNVWIGTSVEDQKSADERIPVLVQIPATVRFLSCEPLIGRVDLTEFFWYPDERSKPCFLPREIHWVICGGESGHHARPMPPDWVRTLRDQCNDVGVPFFFKQWGTWSPDNDDTTHAVNVEPEGTLMFKQNKKISSNLLDGRQHLEFPPINPHKSVAFAGDTGPTMGMSY